MADPQIAGTETPQGGDGQPTTPPEQPGEAGGTPFHPITSQEQLEKVIGARLARQERSLSEKLTPEIATAVRGQLEQEYQPLRTELDTLKQQRIEAERAAMTDVERAVAEVADAKAEADRLKLELAQREAVNQALVTQQRVHQLEVGAKAVAPGLPVSLFRPQLEALAGEDGFSLEAALQSVRSIGEDYRASLEALGLSVKPTAIGSGAQPPAPPRGDADAELQDMIQRAETGDPSAIKALEARFSPTAQEG